MKNKLTRLLLLLVLITLIPGLVYASATESTNRVYVSPEQTLEGATFLSGHQIQVDGIIDGDLYAVGQDVIINGQVRGDIIAAAQTISILSPIEGNLRLAGQTVRISKPVSGSATIASQVLSLDTEGRIGRDLVFGANTVNISGEIARNIYGGASILNLSGNIGNTVHLYGVQQLNLLDGAMVGGDLIYSSEQKAYISPNASLIGNERWQEIKPVPDLKPTHALPWSLATLYLLSLAGLLIVYWVFRLWKKESWDYLATPATAQPWSSFGIGLLTLLATPILFVLLLITVIGIPLGIILILAYGVFLYLSTLIVSQSLTQRLRTRFNYRGHDFWPFMIILIILTLVTKIPLIGWLIGLIVLSLGLGSSLKAILVKKEEAPTADLPPIDENPQSDP